MNTEIICEETYCIWNTQNKLDKKVVGYCGKANIRIRKIRSEYPKCVTCDISYDQ